MTLKKNPIEILYNKNKLGCGHVWFQVQVGMEFLQGKDMGRVIVEEAKKQRVSLLVLGQRKQSPFLSLVKKFSTKKRRNHGGIVEFCIQNSSCPTIAVRRKSKKLGGYLITTKSHKNFWLLAWISESFLVN